MRVPRLSLGKLFNVLQSPIGWMASWPMRNIKTFPSKQMYLYLSLLERKEAEYYHNIDRRHYLVWFKCFIFIAFPGQFMVSLECNSTFHNQRKGILEKTLPKCRRMSVWFSICPLRHAHHHLPPQHLPHRHHHHVVKAKQAHAHINLLREAGALSQLPWTPESNISGLLRLLFVFRKGRCTKLLNSKYETSDLRCHSELREGSGGGSFSTQKNYIADFGNFKQGFLSMNTTE